MTKDMENFINSYKVGEYLYGGVLRRKFGLSSIEILALMQRLVRDGLFEEVNWYFCPSCQNRISYELDEEILKYDEWCCDYCDCEFQLSKSIEVNYRKTK